MKTVVRAVLFFVVFVGISFAGFIVDPFHLKWFVTHPTVTSTRYFVPDGLLLLVGLYLVVLGISALRKRLGITWIGTTIGFILALIFGIYFKFGWTGYP
jgi:hypothetical protein